MDDKPITSAPPKTHNLITNALLWEHPILYNKYPPAR